MGRIFLSYARDDEDVARELAGHISSAGHEVWWDRNLQGGSRFTVEIDKALKDAEAVVVLWSDAAVESAWVQDEAAEGRDSGRLIPISLGSTKPPLGFRQFHTIALGSWNGNGQPRQIDDLLDAIGRTCGAAPREQNAEQAQATQTPRRGASVCVLPFVNMSGDPEQEYFSDGISEDIITDLSKISALSVVARNTAFNLKGKEIDIKEVSRRLGVTHVLEGSVRKAGGRVRINAQLIDAIAGDHVWAERFDRDLADIFAIQDELSKAIVDALQLKLLPKEKKALEKRETDNPEAYNLYLKARQQWISGNDGNSRRDEVMVRICRQTTAIDPNYARAWALMALAQAELRFRHDWPDEDALSSAERALELNPSIAEAHCVKARYLADEKGQPDEAKRELETALALDPDSWEVNKEVARQLFRKGEMKAAIPYFEKAARLVETDYHSPGLLFTCYSAIGDTAGAEQAARMAVSRAEKAVAQDPTNGAALGMGASSLAELGEVERAKEWTQNALLMDPNNLTMRYNLVCGLAKLDPDGAIDLLGSFIDRMNSMLVTHLAIDPDINPLRDHPRFKDMLASAMTRLGMPVAA